MTRFVDVILVLLVVVAAVVVVVVVEVSMEVEIMGLKVTAGPGEGRQTLGCYKDIS